ncbi:hypothetical protein DAPPUDRAFT_331871 [Daphnia pulex]|uniref:MADF domain-containing protein n=1 Tax=Daphnia pulex TaxID=6669 RepID=E9HNP7_DAPPU|nr:hypothetical protein DAPPUDRAFT_331871 [Daphnia pulex]|eukprot:EFX66651.1 hypothetical protein DAPPUDRAFT_331871 [Daphnia pulex]
MSKKKSPIKSPNLGVNGASKQTTNAKEKRARMWSKATTERFIQSIEKHKVLYDLTMSDYKNQVTQATARAVISSEGNFQSVCCPGEVKRKWKQLKDTYRCEKKRLNEEDPSGSGLEGSKRAKKLLTYFDQMGFVSTVHEDAENEYII